MNKEWIILLADVPVKVTTNDIDLYKMVKYLFRYNQDQNRETSFVIELILGDYGEEKKPVLLNRSKNNWIWGIPSKANTWSHNQFYYRSFFPVIGFTLTQLNVSRLHGALLYDIITKGILLLGDRGDGKSTTALSWILEGGKLVTDDTVLVTNNMDKMYFSGLHRELHLTPSTSSLINDIVGFEGCIPYLPGHKRLDYDWCHHFPENVCNSLNKIEHIIKTNVSVEKKSSIQKLSETEVEVLFDRYWNEDETNVELPNHLYENLRAFIIKSYGWEIIWGNDIWNYPGKHLGFLRDNLK